MTRDEYNKLRKLQSEHRKKEVADFKQLLDNHDWYYFQSDDTRTHQRGVDELNVIKKKIAIDKRLRRMYEEKKKKIFR